MSLVKVNSAQIGQSATATQNFTLAVPASPDGTVKLARGNSGATTQDVLTVDASGNVNAPVGLQQGGVATGRMVLSTAQNTTSGTAIDFTGIPSWAKKITVMFNGVSTTGLSNWWLQIGSGSIVSTGYAGGSLCTQSASVSGTGVVNSSAFVINSSINVATSAYYGKVELYNISGNTWVQSGMLVDSTAVRNSNSTGVLALSGSLDRLRITSATPDTFDAGSVNILYEG